MTVHIPSALQSYTAQQREIEVTAATVAEALSELNRRYPGFRFRIVTEQDTVRPHMRIFVNETQTFQLNASIQQEDHVYIVCALSGG